jgi:hypothetical protein
VVFKQVFEEEGDVRFLPVGMDVASSMAPRGEKGVGGAPVDFGDFRGGVADEFVGEAVRSRGFVVGESAEELVEFSAANRVRQPVRITRGWVGPRDAPCRQELAEKGQVGKRIARNGAMRVEACAAGAIPAQFAAAIDEDRDDGEGGGLKYETVGSAAVGAEFPRVGGVACEVCLRLAEDVSEGSEGPEWFLEGESGRGGSGCGALLPEEEQAANVLEGADH